MPPSRKSIGFRSELIQFPTDRLTLRDMRRHEPELFTSDTLADLDACGLEVVATHYWELVCAEKAFAHAAGVPDPHLDVSREEIIEAIEIGYRRMRITEHPGHAEKLIQAIEDAAAQQARSASRGR